MKAEYVMDYNQRRANIVNTWATAILKFVVAGLLFVLTVTVAISVCMSVAKAEEVDEWTAPQITTEIVVQALTFADYRQTSQIRDTTYVTSVTKMSQVYCGVSCTMQFTDTVKTYHGYVELNPFLGAHPSHAKTRNYFIVSDVAGLALAHFLPTSYRGMWLGVQIGAEGLIVRRNLQLGLSGRF